MANERKLDRTRAFGRVSSMGDDLRGVAYAQDGWYFDSNEVAVKEMPGYAEAQRKSAAAAEAKAADQERTAENNEAADRAAAILGDLDSGGSGDAQKENAAAENAERLADDAPPSAEE